MENCKRPRFEFGAFVQYSSIDFQVKTVEYRDRHEAGSARPEGFYYKDHRGVWHHEDAINRKRPEVKPISVKHFNMVWNRHYGCTWDSPKSGALYRGMVEFLLSEGMLYAEEAN